MESFRYYLRRTFLAPGFAAIREIGFFVFALLIASGAVMQVWPALSGMVRNLYPTYASVLSPTYYGLVLLVMTFSYRERYKRVLVERKGAKAALRPFLESMVEMYPFAEDDSARANIMLLDGHEHLQVRFRSTRMIGARDAELRLRLDEGNAGPACQRGRTRVNPNPESNKYGLKRQQFLDTIKLRLIISVPILEQSDPEVVIGILNLDSEKRYDTEQPAFKATVASLESQAQALAPLLEMSGEITHRHRVKPQRSADLA